MGLNTFGVLTSDLTTDAAGNSVGGIQLTVWTSRTRTAQVTDLYDLDGTTPLPGFVTSSSTPGAGLGRYSFKASDAYSTLWLWDGNPENAPWAVLSAEASANIGLAIDKADQASTDAAAAQSAASAAQASASAADGRSTEALDMSQQALDTAQATLTRTGNTAPAIADLVSPIIVAHRGGGGNVLPEEALETYRAVRDRGGVSIVEADVYLLRDGSTACMHDGTVDRTTNGTGSTGKFTAAGIQRLRIDAGTSFLTGWPSDLRVPTLDDVLDTVGRGHAIAPEAKNAGSGQAIVDRVVARGLQQSTLVQAFDQAELAPATDAGIQTGLLHSTGVGLDFAAIAAAGVDWMLLGSGAAQAQFDAAAAAGLRLGVWTVDRHVDRDKFLLWGVELFFSDDPWYLGGNDVLTEDPFEAGTWGDGMLGATVDTVAARGTFASGGWKIDSTVGGYGSALQGWACPIKGLPGADTFTIDFAAVFEAVNYGTAWGGVVLCRPDDLGYTDSSQAGMTGYHCLFRQSGAMDVYKITNGVATKVAGITASSAPAIGASRSYRVQVTPTQLIFSVPGLAAPNSVTVTDNTYRGGYFHLGARDARVRYADVLIS